MKKPLKIFLACLLAYNLLTVLPAFLYLLGIISLSTEMANFLPPNFTLTLLFDGAVAFVLGIAYIAKHII